jgi:hypothetical protein
MPAAIPIIIAAATSAAGAALAGATLASTLAIAALSAAATFLTSALAPKQKTPQFDFRAEGSSRTIQVKESSTEWRVVYGEARIAGAIKFWETTDSNKYHHVVILLAAHECQEIGTIYFNGEPINSDQLDGSGNVTSGKYSGKARIKKHLGTADQAADSDLINDVSIVDSNFRFRGHTYLYIRFEADTETFPTGLPLVEAEIKGIKTYDTRTDTTYWTPNPALCVRDFFTDTSGYGVGSTAARINDSYVTSEANICDEFVATRPVLQVVDNVSTGDDYLAIEGDVLQLQTGDRVEVVEGTNLLTYSEDFSHGNWNKANVAVTANSTEAPDGNTTADTLTTNPASRNACRARQFKSLSLGASYTANINMKAGTANGFISLDNGGSTVYGYVKATLTGNGSVSVNGTNISATIVKGDLEGWYRVSLTWSVTTVANFYVSYGVWDGGSDSSNYPGAEPGETVIVWGAQHQPGLTYGAYIVTTSSTVSGTLPTGISASTNYYVICRHREAGESGEVQVQLASSYTNALAGTAIDITAAGSGTHTVTKNAEPRYTCNGVLYINKEWNELILPLLSSMGGSFFPVGSQWVMLAAAYRTPTISYDESDLRDRITVQTRHSRSKRFNSVRGQYVSPLNYGQPTDYPVVSVASYVTADGSDVIYEQFDTPFTSRSNTAQRLARIKIEQHRRELTAEAKLKITGMQSQAGDVIQFSNTRFGWSNKTFDVVSHALLGFEDESGDPAWGCDLTLRETDASVYTFTSSSDEATVAPAPTTTLPEASTVIAPTNLTLASGTAHLYRKIDGTVVTRLYASWTASVDFYVRGYEVQVKRNADSEWEPATSPADQTFVYIWDVEDGVSYDVRVRAINSLGVRSAWLTVTGHTVVGKTTPPSDVANFSAQQNGNVVNFRWTQVSDADLSGYEIRYANQGAFVWEDATPLTKVTKGTLVTNGAVPPGAQTVGVKAVDTSGNESTTATTFDITVRNTNDVITQVVQHPRWPGFKDNLIVHDVSGRLVPLSTDSDATGNNFDVFDNFVLNPEATCCYEALEIDLGFDADEVRVYAQPLTAAAGVGETGNADVQLAIAYDEALMPRPLVLTNHTLFDEMVFRREGNNSTFFDSLLILVTAAENILRWEYLANGYSGLLIEDDGENLVEQSEDISSSYWSSTFHASVSLNTHIAPDGKQTADTFHRTRTAACYRGKQFSKSAENIQYTGSVFIDRSAGIGDYVAIRFQGSYPGRADFIYRKSTNTIVTTASYSGFSGLSYKIKNVNGNFVRLELTFTTDTHTAVTYFFSANSNGVALDGTDVITNASAVFWGFQLDLGAYARSYKATNGSTGSTSKDVLQITAADPDSTNLIEAANNFTAGSWTSVGGSTATLLAGTKTIKSFGLDVTLKRYSIDSQGASWHRVQNAENVTSGTIYSATLIYEDSGTSGKLRIILRNDDGATESAISGSIGSVSVSASTSGSVSIISETEIAEGVYQLLFTYTPNFTGSFRYGVGADSSTIGETVVVLASQFEEASAPSRLIVTSGTALNRPYTARSWFNITEFAVLIEAVYLGELDTSTGRRLFEISNGASSVQRAGVGILSGGNLGAYTVKDDVVVSAITGQASPAADTVYRVAASFKQNSFKVCVNGGTVGKDTSGDMPTDLTTITIGNAGLLNYPGDVLIRSVKLYPVEFTDAQMQSSTAAGGDAPDGFVDWSVGSVDARYIRQRLKLDNTSTVGFIEEHTAIADATDRLEKTGVVTISASGSTITYADYGIEQFHLVPDVQVTVNGGSALTPTYENVTTTSVDIHVFNSAGTEVGGDVSITFSGV